MKAGIIGAGALGSLFAYNFHEHLVDFVIYENDKALVDEIQSAGLTFIKGDSSRTIMPVVSASPEILNDAGIILILVKSYSTYNALNDINNVINSDAIMVSLQNGLGNIDIIRKFIPDDRIVYGTTTIGASKKSPSTAVAGGSGVINIGGSEKSHVIKVHHLLNSAGLSSYITEEPDRLLWQKAVINAGINPIATILNITNGEILTCNHALMLQEKIIQEAVESAAANSIKLDFTEMLNKTKDVCEKTSSNICSMLQDLRYGRKTEIDSITGKIIEAGENIGVKLPYNNSLFLLIKSMETIHSQNR